MDVIVCCFSWVLCESSFAIEHTVWWGYKRVCSSYLGRFIFYFLFFSQEE